MSNDERWTQINDSLASIAKSHSELRESVDNRFEVISQKLADHDVVIKKINDTHDKTQEVVDILAAMQGGVKVIGWIGSAVKFAWPLAALAAAIWLYFTTGKWSYQP